MDYFAYIAFAIVVAAILVIIWGRCTRKNFAFRYPLGILVGAVFMGLVLTYFPLARMKYLEAYPGGGRWFLLFIPLAQSMQSAFRTFVLDGEWSELLSKGTQIPASASMIGVFLNVLAPMLTFSAILSLFNELRSGIRLWLIATFGDHLILMSELNKDSICLAEDIIKRDKKAGIIFTDVYPEDDESSFELREQAIKLNAVFLRTDISELKISKRKGLTEYFILGHDEEENVMQAEKLFRKNSKRTNTSIYVRAVHDANALILDSLNDSIEMAGTGSGGTGSGRSELTYDEMKNKIRSGGILRFRRFDPEKEAIWKAIPEMRFLREAFAAPYSTQSSRELSVMVIGDTHQAFTVVKTLLWYAQSDKFRLALNIVHTDQSKLEPASDEIESWPADIRKLLETECPDIIRTNRMSVDGDAFYDIEFYEREELESLYLRHLWGELSDKEDDAKWKRIGDTNAVLIDCQKDIDTIETAIKTRRAFARIDKIPEIYAVCTDAEDILAKFNENNRLSTHEGANYNFIFAGKRSDTYTYENFLKTEAEELGYCQHIKWVDVGGDKNRLKDQLISYAKREYYRDASISKAMYLRNVIADPEKERSAKAVQEEISKITSDSDEISIDENSLFERRLVFRDEYECEKKPSDPADRWHCTCSKCMLRRKMEHNRWNAYMRTLGYISSPTGNVKANIPLAGIHGNIVPFDVLREKAPESIEKDS